MNNKNKTATIIASVIVGIAVVTGSVYAAVTASKDRDEIESTTVITTQEESVSEATTEPESSTSEPAINNPAPNTSTSQDMQSTAAITSTAEFDPNYISPEHYNSMTPEQKEISYQHELAMIEDMYERSMKTSREIRMPLPDPPSENATDKEIEDYNRKVRQYTPLNDKADEIEKMAEETRTRMINELNQKYGR